MDHVAIMRKSWGLIPKILNGTKKIESRWSKFKISPWDKVKTGDTVYFKNAGEPVTAKAGVSKVLQFDDLNPGQVRGILNRYGGVDGIAVNDLQRTFEWAKNKKYCVLIYLKNPQKTKSFNINKSDFGIGAAWLSVKNIKEIKWAF